MSATKAPPSVNGDQNGRTGSLLAAQGLTVHYGKARALFGIDFQVPVGGCVAILGPNGAGKTTLLRVISGLVRPTAGSVMFDGRDVTAEPAHKLARAGLAHVQEGRGIFPRLTVGENLRVVTDRVGTHALDEVLEYFPRLRERQRQQAGTLSGGEQQMLALSIALLRRPKLLLVDEPSLGLAPMVVREIYDTFSRIRRSGTSIVIVEQFVHMVLGLADRVYLLNKGGLVFSGEPEQLGKDASGEQQHLMGAYLGTQGLEVATERRRSVATEQVKLPLPVTFVRALEDHAAREGLTLAQVVAASMDQIMSGVPSNGQGGMRG